MSALIECVMTFSPKGYGQYGRNCINTFKKHWHGNILLSVYAEGMNSEGLLEGERIRIRSYEYHCPQGVAFKEQETPEPPNVAQNRYRFEAKKFSHKAFALADAARRSKADYLILMDADIETHGYVSPEWVEFNCFYADTPEGALKPHVACLLRPFYHHTECAFVLYRLCDKTRDMIETIEKVYTSGYVFNLPGWCDSSVFDYVRGRFEEERGLLVRNLTTRQPEDGLTVFEESILGEKMRHLKGKRKFNVNNELRRVGNGGGELGAPYGPHQPHP